MLTTGQPYQKHTITAGVGARYGFSVHRSIGDCSSRCLFFCRRFLGAVRGTRKVDYCRSRALKQGSSRVAAIRSCFGFTCNTETSSGIYCVLRHTFSQEHNEYSPCPLVLTMAYIGFLAGHCSLLTVRATILGIVGIGLGLFILPNSAAI
jgi:hypothetical protein